MSIDWDTYKPDVTRLYINGNKTAEETIEYLNERHGADITIKKFKSEFGSLKKLQAKEWRAIFQEIRKRKAGGKDSDVYLCGRRLNQSRVDRAKRRYDKGPDPGGSASTFDQSRIEIRSPAAQNRETIIEASFDAVRTSTDHGYQEGVRPEIRSTPAHNAERVAARVSRDTTTAQKTEDERLPQVSADGRYIDDVDIHEISYDFSTPTLDNDFIHDLTDTPYVDMPAVMDISDRGLIPFLAQSTIPMQNTICSIFNLNHQTPRHHRRFTSPQAAMSVRVAPSFFNVIPGCSTKFLQPFWNSKGISNIFPELQDTRDFVRISSRQSHARVMLGKVGWISSRLVDTDPTLRLLLPAESVLENILFNSNPGGRPTREVWPSMNMDQKSIYQIFTVILYLVSNNHLQTHTIKAFITSVISSGYFGQLSKFLKDCVSGSCEARVFIVKALQAAIPTSANGFLSRSSLFKTHPDESFQLLLALDECMVLGSLGIDLLITAANSNHLAAVQKLVVQGVDVNGVNDQFDCDSQDASWTPLSRAVMHGSLELVRFLVESGAEVNTQLSGISANKTALTLAAKHRRVEIVSTLLTEVATIRLHPKTLQDAKVKSPDIYQLLLGKLEGAEAETLRLVEAAAGGAESISQFLLARNIVEDEVLECGLHHAVVGCNVRAVRTLLRRGVDPMARKYRKLTQFANPNAEDEDQLDREASHNMPDEKIFDVESGDDGPFESELSNLRFGEHSLVLLAAKRAAQEDKQMQYILYLLVKAGARLKMKTIQRIQDEVPEDVGFDLYTILFSAGHDVSSIGLEILNKAAATGNFYKCTALLDIGIPIDAYGSHGLSSLQIAAEGGNLTLVQYLLDRGANVNLPAYHHGGRTALQAAVSEDHSNVIDCLLDAGADVMAPAAKESGLTVLEAAAQAEEVIFKKLLALGAPVNRPNGEPGQVLHALIQESKFECLKLALRAGARIEDRYLVNPFEPRRSILTPLQFAAHRLDEQAIQLLLEHGADVNALAIDGHTALQCALSPHIESPYENFNLKLQAEIVQLLLDNEANANAPASPNFGRTALQVAASYDDASPYLVDLLLQRDADVNAEPAMRGGVTAIQGAAINGNLQIARMLLDLGANVNAPAAPEEGRTAIEGAAEHGRLEMVRLLLRSGALPDPVTGFSTAIAFAKARNHWGVADLLEESQNAFDPFSLSFCDPLTWASELIDNEHRIF
ncbi:ankyrin repeat-containing domain protein [Ilyonectria sp. MPI-CAGE-AT-0026]|nr:ankyrin repeat-containing domain protein [Ilyonectria sp. MPI-CAGE-AT-0026]